MVTCFTCCALTSSFVWNDARLCVWNSLSRSCVVDEVVSSLLFLTEVGHWGSFSGRVPYNFLFLCGVLSLLDLSTT